MKKIKRIIESCYMCVKYPFLYPRNRFTGLHYNNWTIIKWKSDLIKKYKQFKLNDYECDIKELINKPYYNRTGRVITYWTNYWARPLVWLIKIYHTYILQFFHCVPTFNEWYAMPKGWNKAFGKQLLDELKTQLKKDGLLYKCRITDLKEKYGSLHLYMIDVSEKALKIIDKYENISYHTCITCGKPATKYSTGWICPYCDDCIDGNYITLEEIKKYENC